MNLKGHGKPPAAASAEDLDDMFVPEAAASPDRHAEPKSLPSVKTCSYLDDDEDEGFDDTFSVGEYHASACPVCLERFTLGNPAVILRCEHGFHLQCIESWRMRCPECPVCLRPMARDEARLMESQDTRRRGRRCCSPRTGGPTEASALALVSSETGCCGAGAAVGRPLSEAEMQRDHDHSHDEDDEYFDGEHVEGDLDGDGEEDDDEGEDRLCLGFLRCCLLSWCTAPRYSRLPEG